MSINYCERLEYRLREVLIKIKRANKWIKDYPSEKNANMDEIKGEIINLFNLIRRNEIYVKRKKRFYKNFY